MKEQPKYSGIFQYIVENYQFPDKSSPEEEFQEKDIEDQYEKLDGHVNEKRFRFGSLEDAAGVVKEFAIGAGADLVGFTRVKDDMKFEGADVPGEYAVILGYEMDREVIQTAPEPPAGREALRAYWRLGYIVQKVAEFIRYLGYPARGHQVRSFIKDPPTVLLPIAGVHAGLGEVGRMGLLITPEFGPRVRLGAVTTDLVLPDSGPKSFGVEEFCSHCDLCMEGCMGNAIPGEKKLERGMLKYTIDPKGCAQEFARYDGCGICIKVCPFNRPGGEMEWFLQGVHRMKEDHHL